jgi:ATP-dependent DNA helicase RecG
MQEHQSIEWKESWQDEYLKWICGYANAQGGTLVIGKDDNGVSIGISNPQKLLKDIPGKITSTMGIIADVNLLLVDGFECLEIVVAKYPSLISYRGKYYYRSGSTLRTINGAELEMALSKSMGRTWDGIPIPNITASDLRQEAIDIFKEKAVARGRLALEDVDVSNQVLLENLNLYDDHNLIRAAVMAFHKDPEKWVTGSHIKIGYSVTDSDIRYMDEVHGSLIDQVDKVMDLVYTKYLKALIDYEGTQRIEQFMFHPDAFKEILLNAIVHKDYRGCNPIQISVYEDKIYVYNDGIMPASLNTTEKLFSKHSSKPFNPKLAQVFFKSGMIEAWGRGFDKIREACAKYDDAPLPEYDISETGVMVLCKPCARYMRLLNNGDSVSANERTWSNMIESLSEHERKNMDVILNYLNDNMMIDNAKGRELTGKSAPTVNRYLRRMREVGILEKNGSTYDSVYTKVIK